MIRRLLAALGRHGPGLLALGILIGLVLPGPAHLLHPLLAPLVFCLAVATMIRIDWPAVAAHIAKPWRVALALAWGLGASPVITAAVATHLGLPEGLAQAIVIWSAAPAMISAPALAFLLGLDASLALIVMVGGALLMPLSLPPLALGLLGVALPIGIAALMLRLGLFIGGALTLAALLRRVAGTRRINKLSNEINGLNVLILMIFAVGIMDGVRDIAVDRPSELLLYAVAAFTASLGQQLVGTIIFLWCGRIPAMTIGMSYGNRNLASVWASLGHFATPELTLFLITLQLPIYILPVVLQPLYRRLAAQPAGRVDARRATQ
jgi:BASS family bile acid:Na+ symporter